MKRLITLVLLLSMGGGFGCRSAQLASDQDQFRARLLDLYTNQIMDNLIRADQGYPIVQMDYTNITGTITQNGTGSFTSTQTTMNTKMLVIPTIVRTLTHSFTNLATFNPSAYETAALTVTANPVINSNDVYNAYLEFLAKTPSRLIKTEEPPPPGTAHIVRCVDHMYYWVPTEFKGEFLKLSLVTTVQRGQPLSDPDKFQNTIVSATEDVSSGTQHRVTVKFGTKMPNGIGTMYCVIGGAQRTLPLQEYLDPVQPDPNYVHVAPGKPTDTFFVTYDQQQIPVAIADFLKQLKDPATNPNVNVDLYFFKPPPQDLSQLVNQIQNNTQLLRIQNSAH
jgi:hypothetical protein